MDSYVAWKVPGRSCRCFYGLQIYYISVIHRNIYRTFQELSTLQVKYCTLFQLLVRLRESYAEAAFAAEEAISIYQDLLLFLVIDFHDHTATWTYLDRISKTGIVRRGCEACECQPPTTATGSRIVPLSLSCLAFLHFQALAMNYITQVAIAKNDYEKVTFIKKLSKSSGLIELCSIDW